MTDNGYTEGQLLDDGYAIFEPPTTDPTSSEPHTRYFAVIVHKPAEKGDPISFLSAIYRAEMVEAYWRGTREEAEDALSEYLAERVG
jgi:hypothetical protein